MRKWWVVIVCCLFLITGVGIGIFYLDQFANLPSVMTARNWYQNSYISVVGKLRDERSGVPVYNLPYSIQIQPWMDRYVYTLYGTLVEANEDSKEILVTGDDGKNYVIKPSKWLRRDLGWEYESETITFEQEYIQLGKEPMRAGDRIRVMWDDERKLVEIRRSYRDDPNQPINIGYSRFFFFTHRNR